MNKLLKIVLSSVFAVTTSAALIGTAYGQNVQSTAAKATSVVGVDFTVELKSRKEFVANVIHELFTISKGDMSRHDQAKKFFTANAWATYVKASNSNMQKITDEKATVWVEIIQLTQGSKKDSIIARVKLIRGSQSEQTDFEVVTTASPKGSKNFSITSFDPL